MCPTCLHEFDVENGQMKCRLKQMAGNSGGHALYCSRICGNKNHLATPQSLEMYRVLEGQGISRRNEGGAHWRTLVCPVCDKKYDVTLSQMNRRLRQMAGKSGGTTLYCSKACGSYGKHVGTALKRRSNWNDETWYWEQLLSKAGLGIYRGSTIGGKDLITNYLDTDGTILKWLDRTME